MQLPKKLTASGNVVVLLSLMYFITYVDRVNISTAAPAIKGEFGLGNTELGLIFSAFAYPYALFQVFGGWLGDKWGARLTLFLCGTIWVAATILTGLAGGLASLFGIRFMLGFGEGATFPTATRAMQNWVARDRRGFAQGFVHSAARLGNAITPPVVAALIALVTWRGCFVLLGLISLVWGLVWVWYFRDDPRQHRGVTEAELARLPVQDAAEARPRVALGPADAAHPSGDDYPFQLWMVVLVVYHLAAVVLQGPLQFGPPKSSTVPAAHWRSAGRTLQCYRRRDGTATVSAR